MKYKTKRIFHFLILALIIILGLYILNYYFAVQSVDEIRRLPVFLLIVVIVYIFLQYVKKFVQKEAQWYNWLYYIGLVAVIIPLPLFGLSDSIILPVTRYGTLFLVIPPIVELANLFKKEK